jgi:hypothetical protein
MRKPSAATRASGCTASTSCFRLRPPPRPWSVSSIRLKRTCLEGANGGSSTRGRREVRARGRRSVHRRRVAEEHTRGPGPNECRDRAFRPGIEDSLAQAPRRTVPVRPDRQGPSPSAWGAGSRPGGGRHRARGRRRVALPRWRSRHAGCAPRGERRRPRRSGANRSATRTTRKDSESLRERNRPIWEWISDGLRACESGCLPTLIYGVVPSVRVWGTKTLIITPHRRSTRG